MVRGDLESSTACANHLPGMARQTLMPPVVQRTSCQPQPTLLVPTGAYRVAQSATAHASVPSGCGDWSLKPPWGGRVPLLSGWPSTHKLWCGKLEVVADISGSRGWKLGQ